MCVPYINLFFFVKKKGFQFGGGSVVFAPNGDLLVETTPDEPVAAVQISLAKAQQAKAKYPRYVVELAPHELSSSLDKKENVVCKGWDKSM